MGFKALKWIEDIGYPLFTDVRVGGLKFGEIWVCQIQNFVKKQTKQETKTEDTNISS